jgi:hypothetical protein
MYSFGGCLVEPRVGAQGMRLIEGSRNMGS